jgi:hypothetical protein
VGRFADQQTTTSRSVLAERILKAAAHGERDPDSASADERPLMKVAADGDTLSILHFRNGIERSKPHL